ncbi:MAG: UDP-N-acetylglucosamine 2-epimerase [Nitrospinota bacterium]
MHLLILNYKSSNLLSLLAPVARCAKARGHGVLLLNADHLADRKELAELACLGIEVRDVEALASGSPEEVEQALGELLLGETLDALILPAESDHPEHRLGRAAVRAFRRRALPSLVLQHGLLFEPELYLPFEADLMAVWSSWYKKRLMALGAEGGRLRVTGSPKFDALAGGSRGAEKNTITLATNTHWARYTEEQNRALFRSLYPALEELGEHLTIKLHPEEVRQGRNYYMEGLEDFSFPREVIRGPVHWPELLSRSKVLLHTCSTVALEAIIAGVPVITIDFTEKLSLFDGGDAALTVREGEELLPALRQALLNPEEALRRQAPLVAKHNYLNDGRAAERVVDLLEGLDRARKGSSLAQPVL